MIFTPTKVESACVIDLEPRFDERGMFARAWCAHEFAAKGLIARLAQVNVSHNICRSTLRGMHYQLPPHEEAKVVSCIRGAVYDVVLDLRPCSPTYLNWDAVELTGDNRRMLYLPPGCAHGFQSLTDDTQLLYLVSSYHAPAAARGVRHDDPVFGITWPLEVAAISEADRNWPDYHSCRRAATAESAI